MSSHTEWATTGSISVSILAPGEHVDAFGQENDTIALALDGLVIEARRIEDFNALADRIKWAVAEYVAEEH